MKNEASFTAIILLVFRADAKFWKSNLLLDIGLVASNSVLKPAKKHVESMETVGGVCHCLVVSVKILTE